MSKYMLPTKFTVDRSKWLRGEGTADSYLLRGDDGKMCCVGFLAKSCGFNDEDIMHRRGFSDAWLGMEEEPIDPATLGFGRMLEGCVDIYVANDDDAAPSDSIREAKLKLLFQKQNIEVEFIDG